LALWLFWLLGLQIVFWVGVYAIALPILLPFMGRLARAYVAVHCGGAADSVTAVIAVRD
jgi:hypothetical protein